MINLLVWSKDRACQLELLLRSIHTFAPNTFDVQVIYKASNENFDEAYERVMVECDKYDLVLSMLGETDFRTNTLDVLNDDEFELCCLSTDDTVLYRPLPLIGAELEECLDNTCVSFSLRLGLNTLVQDIHNNTVQPPLNNPEVNNEVMKWDWTQYHPNHNYGYPFGLDMHVYSTKTLTNLINNAPFVNTNELESYLYRVKQYSPQYMKSFTQSVAVNVPVNSISGVTRAGEFHDNPIEYLNDKFLDGNDIDLTHIAAQQIVGCHQEIDLKWIG